MPDRASQNHLYLGIDVGTSGCRAIAIDANGDIVVQSRVELPASTHPARGHSEQQAGDWWRAITDVIGAIERPLRERVTTIAVDGTSASLLLSDQAGEPLTAALMYDDRRAVVEAQQIAHVAPPDSPAQGPGSALAKLLYLQAGIDEQHRIHALHQADWIAARLSGRYDISDENNCLKLGYDPIERRWPDWMGRLPLRVGALPTVLPIGTRVGTLVPTAAQRLGLRPETVVVTGSTDSNAAALAAGVSQTGEAVTSLGSTLVVKVLSDHPVTAAEYGVYSHRIGDRWLVGGASNSGGTVLRQHFVDDELDRLSTCIDPHTDSGLDYYPLPARGERFPVNDPQMQSRMSPRPDDRVRFLHGLLEGIARIEARGYARLAELGCPTPTRVFSSGGGAGNDVWRQIRQRYLGVPVLRARFAEAAYGAALLARSADAARL